MCLCPSHSLFHMIVFLILIIYHDKGISPKLMWGILYLWPLVLVSLTWKHHYPPPHVSLLKLPMWWCPSLHSFPLLSNACNGVALGPCYNGCAFMMLISCVFKLQLLAPFSNESIWEGINLDIRFFSEVHTVFYLEQINTDRHYCWNYHLRENL